MPPCMYLVKVVWPGSGIDPTCLLFLQLSLPCAMAWETYWCVLYSIQNGWLVLNCVKALQTASCCWKFDWCKWNSHRNSPVFIGFLWWRYYGCTYCALLSEKIEGWWWKCGRKRPSLSPQLTMWRGKKVDGLVKKNSPTTEVEKLNIGLVHINEITEGLAYNKVCAQRMLRQLMPKMKTATLEARQQLLLLRKWGYWFSLVLRCYRGWEVGCNTTAWKRKASHFVTPLLPERKNPRLCLLLENARSQFYWYYKSVIHWEYMVKGMTINT